MQEHTPIASAVGVELGTSTLTVSIRRGDEPIQIRRFDGEAASPAVLDRVRAAREEVVAGPAPVAFAVPASWERTRHRDLAEAAERAGLGEVDIVAAPEAAAIFLDRALVRGLEPDAALVVCDLGASSCEVAVVRRTGEHYTVEASVGAGEVGGLEFDQLLLAYLSGRYRDTDPEFWDKVDDPGGPDEEALRSKLLDEIRRAREVLSKRARAGIPLPVGDRDLHLTRQELESCIAELVAQSVDLVATALDVAGVEAAGLLLIGGASQTPLLAAKLRERTGLEPIVPDRPEVALAEGARLLALSRTVTADPEAGPRRRSGRRLAVLAAVLGPLIAAAVFFGSELGSGDGPDVDASDSTDTSEGADASDTHSPSQAAAGSGGSGGQEPAGDPQTPVADDGPAGDATPSPSTSSGGNADGGTGGDDREESASAGTVPQVTEMPVGEAEQALNDAGFTNVELEGEREGLFGPWYDQCEVIEQDPADGQQHDFTEPVTLTYSYSGDSAECEQ
ncbi:Hsp70 family protein [Glycomyces tarimensis]